MTVSNAFRYALAAAAAVIAISGVATPGHAAVDANARMECDSIGRITPYRATNTALTAAIKARKWHTARGLLTFDAKPSSRLTARQKAQVRREQRSAALVPAAARGDLAAVRRLLKAGADPNAWVAADNYMTPLAWAARCDHPKVITALIAAGARVDLRVGYYRGQGYIDGSTALIEGSSTGADRAVALLLRHHADVNARSYWIPMEDFNKRRPGKRKARGTTAIYAAINPEIRRMLLRAGANPADGIRVRAD